MKLFRALVNLTLLLVTPTFLLTPHTKLLAAEHIPFGIACHRALTAENNLYFTYDQVMDLLDAIESGHPPEGYSPHEIEVINRYIAGLALEGTLPGEPTTLLEQDILTLLCPFDYAAPYYDSAYALMAPGELTLCKGWISESWDKTKDFVKDHKKEIIIGAAIVVAVTIVVIVVASSGGTAAAAGAAGVAALAENKPSAERTIEEKISSFKELASEEVVLDAIDYQADPTAKETFKNLSAFLAHETLEGIAEISSMVPRLGEELKDLTGKILPQGMALPENNDLFWNSESHEDRYAKGHTIIDEAFATNQAPLYASETSKSIDQFAQPFIPFPGTPVRGLSVPKFRQIATAGRETAALAEELGFSAREISHLEKRGTLQRTVTDAVDKIYSKQKMAESHTRFKNAETSLKPYHGRYMPEVEARRLIQQNGVRTYPRPKGVPDNWRVKLSNTGAGIKYVHPENEHISVRVMPGKPHSPYPHQQKPYVVQMEKGKALDAHGNRILHELPEAHIPINNFVYRE